MGAHHEITQPFARKDLQVPLPDYHRWEGESIPRGTPDNPERSVTGMAAMLLFVSMLAIGTFATLLIVW